MDQNNFNELAPQVEEREPLPTMEYPVAAPVFQQDAEQQKKVALDAQLSAYAAGRHLQQ